MWKNVSILVLAATASLTLFGCSQEKQEPTSAPGPTPARTPPPAQTDNMCTTPASVGPENELYRSTLEYQTKLGKALQEAADDVEKISTAINDNQDPVENLKTRTDLCCPVLSADMEKKLREAHAVVVEQAKRCLVVVPDGDVIHKALTDMQGPMAKFETHMKVWKKFAGKPRTEIGKWAKEHPEEAQALGVAPVKPPSSMIEVPHDAPSTLTDLASPVGSNAPPTSLIDIQPHEPLHSTPLHLESHEVGVEGALGHSRVLDDDNQPLHEHY